MIRHFGILIGQEWEIFELFDYVHISDSQLTLNQSHQKKKLTLNQVYIVVIGLFIELPQPYLMMSNKQFMPSRYHHNPIMTCKIVEIGMVIKRAFIRYPVAKVVAEQQQQQQGATS